MTAKATIRSRETIRATFCGSASIDEFRFGARCVVFDKPLTVKAGQRLKLTSRGDEWMAEVIDEYDCGVASAVGREQ